MLLYTFESWKIHLQNQYNNLLYISKKERLKVRRIGYIVDPVEINSTNKIKFDKVI